MFGNKVKSFTLPIISYAVPTFVLVYPSFFVNWLSDSMHLAYWQVFAIVALPFLGRIIGSFVYQLFKSSVIPYCFPLLGFLVILQNFLGELIFVRFLVGIIFGLLTSYAVESAVRSGRNVLVGFTTAGWSIGWVISYLAYSFLKNWNVITISGIAIMLLALFELNKKEFRRDLSSVSFPKLSSILIYISALTPAFILQVMPSFLEAIKLTWLILPSYLLSIPTYVLLPIISEKVGIRKVLVISSIIVILSCIITFLLLPMVVIVFTSVGLGILGITPKYLAMRGEDPKRMGLALNIGSVMGLIVPVLYGLMPLSSEFLLSILVVLMLLI
ncbi:transporter [Sulfolobus sp. E5-1-F]|uniref:transporter n=1 Tax=Sulfolobaceae TaxID=118883 RepID=UPI00129778B3|nr:MULTISPECIES: transporter [unclassified Sulfolobus]QGA53488.1 transporter [Sulfolobus sp. E5-1-F]QGA68841.1 transporter [Sulfolobus sp. E11-6]